MEGNFDQPHADDLHTRSVAKWGVRINPKNITIFFPIGVISEKDKNPHLSLDLFKRKNRIHPVHSPLKHGYVVLFRPAMARCCYHFHSPHPLAMAGSLGFESPLVIKSSYL